MKFKFKQWCLQFLMNRIADIRYRTEIGGNIDTRLAIYHLFLLQLQMEHRRANGVKEIQCHVVWGIE